MEKDSRKRRGEGEGGGRRKEEENTRGRRREEGVGGQRRREEGDGGGRRREERVQGARRREESGKRRSPDSPPSLPPSTHEGRPGGRKKSMVPPFWQVEIAPLLSQILAPASTDPETLKLAVDQLWAGLSRRSCLGRVGGVAGVKQRSTVLRAVFSLLDSTDPHLLTKLAKIIIAMEVSGNNLLNVCKLLFSLARTETNDQFFIEDEIVAPLTNLLSSCDPVADSDALVYGIGTLKLLASNAELRPLLSSEDSLSLLSSILDCYNESRADPSKQRTLENVLVQLTAMLRNLSESPILSPALLSSHLLPQVAVALSNHLQHPDITFNISRLLSKLTLHSECRAAVLQCPSFLPLLLHSLTVHSNHPEILLRVCFILGNLTAEDHDTRRLLLSTPHTLPTITSLITTCLATEVKQVKEKKSMSPKTTNEDLLIKLVRLLANMSVHPEAGKSVAKDKTSVEQLLSILASLPLSSYHELVANTLATLNNISYHSLEDSCLLEQQHNLSQLLVAVLMEDDRECMLECVRVYGNLSRHASVRQIIAEKKVNELLIALLDSSHQDLVFSSCGVMVNLMADKHHRTVLTNCGGVNKLLDILRDFGPSDWQLAGLVCQILWNFSVNMVSAASCFGEEETELLIFLLQSYCALSPNSLPSPSLADSWRNHFHPAGSGLLDRLTSHHTPLTTHPPPSHHSHSPLIPLTTPPHPSDHTPSSI